MKMMLFLGHIAVKSGKSIKHTLVSEKVLCLSFLMIKKISRSLDIH